MNGIVKSEPSSQSCSSCLLTVSLRLCGKNSLHQNHPQPPTSKGLYWMHLKLLERWIMKNHLLIWLLAVVLVGPAWADEAAEQPAGPTEPAAANATAEVESVATEETAAEAQNDTTVQTSAPAPASVQQADAPAVQIGQSDATAIAPTTQQMTQAQAMQRMLEQRLAKLLVPPSPSTDTAKIQRQLDILNDNAQRLTTIAKTDSAKLQAFNVELNGRYARVNLFATAPDVDAELSRLRATARRVKALRTAESAAIGDFWLMTAELFDINRLTLPLAERQRQAAQVLDAYIDRHPSGPASAQVAAAAQRLNQVRQQNAGHAQLKDVEREVRKQVLDQLLNDTIPETASEPEITETPITHEKPEPTPEARPQSSGKPNEQPVNESTN